VDEQEARVLQLDFSAHLTEKGQCVGFYSDGCGRIVLETSSMELPQIMKLIAFGRRTSFRVHIEIENPQNA
jgi:hypothetical protein